VWLSLLDEYNNQPYTYDVYASALEMRIMQVSLLVVSTLLWWPFNDGWDVVHAVNLSSPSYTLLRCDVQQSNGLTNCVSSEPVLSSHVGQHSLSLLLMLLIRETTWTQYFTRWTNYEYIG
jgi:hypothetical protein